MTSAKDDFIHALAEQNYLFHLLVKVLYQRGVLKEGEPLNLWSEVEFEKFSRDYRGTYFPGVP